MAVELAFLIKDLEPNDGDKDVVGVIAKVDKIDFTLKDLLEEVNGTFDDDKLKDRFHISHHPTIGTKLEEINGVLVGCITLTDCNHRFIEDVANILVDRFKWSGTSASPQAVATFIKQMEAFDCVNPTSAWKGFYNNLV